MSILDKIGLVIIIICFIGIFLTLAFDESGEEPKH